MSKVYDIAVIGGGIIGLATAYTLLRRHPWLALAVVEKERALAAHQSSRNSGVLHTGLYYAPGSLKARLCREGKDALERFADEHGIPYARLGKVVVACDASEVPRLAALKERGLANGVPALEEIGPEQLREIEPHAAGVRALYSPTTGVIDFHRVALAYAEEVESRGGEILLWRRVTSVIERSDLMVLGTTAGDVRARHVIACAGLYADRVASLTRDDGAPARDLRIVPFRGDYYTLEGATRDLVRALIYPVPDPAFPFLGVHLTRRIGGEVWAGPSAVLAFAREGYSFQWISTRDVIETLAFPGFRRLARGNVRAGLAEMWRSVSTRAFARVVQRYLPEMRASDLRRGRSGVRAQAVDREGRLVNDFVLRGSRRVLHVLNAPSPAATASLAIARMLSDDAEERFEIT